MRLVFLGLAVVAAMLLGSATAQAGLITGGASFSGTPQNASSGTVLDTRNVTAVTKTAGSQDFNQAPDITTTWANFVLTSPMPGGGFVLSNATFGTFTANTLLSDTLATEIVAGNGNRTITYKGSFAAGSLFASNIRDATDANLTITLNQSTTGGNTFFSNTMTLTASGVPEPTSIALFGLVALGMVARRFRRK
jgi:PEP-CTERM motif